MSDRFAIEEDGSANFFNNKITNIGDPIAEGDAANKSYVDSTLAVLTTEIAGVQTKLGDGVDAPQSGETLTSDSNGVSNWRPLTRSDVGLTNVDDTSDIDKPISATMQAALDNKVDIKSFVFGTPIDTSAPPATFSSATNGRATPTSLWGSNIAPYPTNVWWQNLVLGTSSSMIYAHPYKLIAGATGMSVTYPKVAYSTKTVDPSSKNITTTTTQNILLGLSETIASRVLVAYDDLTVTERFNVVAGSTYIDAYIAKGSPYVTLRYFSLTPKISTIHAILNVNGVTSFPANITGTKFKVTLNNGQTWIVYFDSSVTLNIQNSGGWRMLASTTFNGVVRLAIRESATDETMLDTYQYRYATAGSVHCFINDNLATTTFNWTAVGSGSLLMLALPHHQDILTGATQIITSIVTIKGPMKAILGDEWIMSQILPTITWHAPNPMDPDKIMTVQTAFNADKSFCAGQPNAVYEGGKQMAKAARLALIGELLGDKASTATLIDNLKIVINTWLDATNTNKLKYDTTWHGIVSTNGLASSGSDYGNGLYNDHHFHWGYFIYSAAVIARNDLAWAVAYTAKVNALVRDIMNPSPTDTYFPKFRMTDWYEGHSWTHGLSESASGKDQESFTEAINAWYGCMLWGEAIGDDNLKDHARILLANEMNGLHRYVQIATGNTIYESPFSLNKTAGILFAAKVDNTTFFGNNLEFITQINTLPITPITEKCLTPTYVSDVYNTLTGILNRAPTFTVTRSGGIITAVNITSSSTNNQGFAHYVPIVIFTGGGGSGAVGTAVITGNELTSIIVTNGGSGYTSDPIVSLSIMPPTDNWKGFVIGEQAIVNKAASWANAQTLTLYDEGNSATNLYYWIATRPV